MITVKERMEPNNLGLWEIEAEPPSPLIEVSLTPDVFAYHELNQPVLFEDMTIIVRSQGDADSSAQRCLISEELFHNFGIPTFKRKNPGISKIDGFPLEVPVRRAWNSLPYSYRGHSQHREPLLGLPLCPHRDRSGSQELAVLKTVAIAGAWQFEDRF